MAISKEQAMEFGIDLIDFIGDKCNDNNDIDCREFDDDCTGCPYDNSSLSRFVSKLEEE